MKSNRSLSALFQRKRKERTKPRQRRRLMSEELEPRLLLTGASTSFEGISSNDFDIGPSPHSANFAGDGFSGTAGIPHLYRTGSFAWMVNAGGTGFINFETPAQSVDFWARLRNNATSGTTVITAYDPRNDVVGSTTLSNPADPFQQVQFTGVIDRIQVVNTTDQMNSIDDFTFNVSAQDDFSNNAFARVTLVHPSGQQELISLTGEKRLRTFWDGQNPGDAIDDLFGGGNNLDDVQTELVSLELEGNSSLGPVFFQANPGPGVRSLGLLEELVDNNTGTLDLDPFAPGDAQSFFDVFFQVDVGGVLLHNELPLQVTGNISAKPEPFGEALTLIGQPVTLLDAASNPSGFVLTGVNHIANPRLEWDPFPHSVAMITLRNTVSQQETQVTLAGPTDIHVYFEGPNEGDAVDDDPNNLVGGQIPDGLDEVLVEMETLSLTGNSPQLGPVEVRLDPTRLTSGLITELVNNNPGRLDVDPFHAGDADSFFDVFVEIEVGGGLVLAPNGPVRVEGEISHKPPPPDEKLQFNGVAPLFAGGQPTDWEITQIMHWPQINLDWGDAPDPTGGNAAADYDTLAVNGGPSHFIVPGLMMGPLIDGELDGQPTLPADGDDIAGAADEDGLISPGPDLMLTEGEVPTVDVAVVKPLGVTTGLYGWIDYDGDGVFEPGEMSTVIIPAGVPGGTVTMTFPTVPVGIGAKSTYARFRLSSDLAAASKPKGVAFDGEVEDYTAMISQQAQNVDYGDAPDDGDAANGPGEYDTLAVNSGPSHGITANVYMGFSVDGEADGQPTAGADGDDIDGNDDEDGLTNPGEALDLVTGQTPVVDVTVTNLTASLGMLYGWIDYDGDGLFENATERASVAVPAATDEEIVQLVFPAVPGGSAASTYARFRLATTTAAADPTGAATDGEVEDYPASIGSPSPDDIGVRRGGQYFRDGNGNGTFDGTGGGDLVSTFGNALPGDELILGDWDGNGTNDLGIARESGGRKQFLRDGNSNGVWDGTAGGDLFSVFGVTGDMPVVGDWDGDGDDDIGIHRSDRIYRDGNDNGTWDGTGGGDLLGMFGNSGDSLFVVDFDGNGVDEIAIRRGNRNYVDLNGNGFWETAAGGDFSSDFGATGDELAIGDWDGNGTDDFGVRRGSQIYRDGNSNGVWDGTSTDLLTTFGIPTDTMIVGDWDDNGKDDIGMHRGSSVYRDGNDNGTFDGTAGGDLLTTFGAPGDVLIVGNWTLPLVAAAGAATTPAASAPLAIDALSPIVTAATDLLISTGLSTSQLSALNRVEFQIADLAGARLGQASGSTIVIDAGAAGYGWFVDTTPHENEEFQLIGNDGLLASGDSAASGHMDLLSVVLHELGHVVGMEHGGDDELMDVSLSTGIRRLPG